MEPITTAAVLAAIKEDYAEKGAAYRYSSNGTEDGIGGACYYRTPVFEDPDGDGEYVVRTEGAAGCFVGRILDKLGVLPAVLYPADGYEAKRADDLTPYIENRDAMSTVSRLGLTFERDRMAQALYAAQMEQDGGGALDSVVLKFADQLSLSVDDLGFTL